MAYRKKKSALNNIQMKGYGVYFKDSNMTPYKKINFTEIKH